MSRTRVFGIPFAAGSQIKDADIAIGFTDLAGFLHGSAQRNDVGGLIIGGILEVLQHLCLIGVFDL